MPVDPLVLLRTLFPCKQQVTWRRHRSNRAPSHKRQATSLTQLESIRNYESYRCIKNYRKLTIKAFKMPGWAYGLPAKECKTGSKLVKVPGSVCFDCYALKGCYVFKVVQAAQYKRLAAIRHPLWTGAMATIINSKKSKYFRWHDSGDVQDEDHLLKIFAVCKLTPTVKHWMPTREAWVKAFLSLKPDNLVIRFSAPMVNTAGAQLMAYNVNSRYLRIDMSSP